MFLFQNHQSACPVQYGIAETQTVPDVRPEARSSSEGVTACGEYLTLP